MPPAYTASMIHAEHTMKIDLGSGELCLRHGQPLRLVRAAGVRVDCLAGNVWITVAGEPADVFLMAGGSYRIQGQGLALIESIGDGRIRLALAPAGKPGRWLKWFVRGTAATGDCASVRPTPLSRTGRAASAPGFPA